MLRLSLDLDSLLADGVVVVEFDDEEDDAGRLALGSGGSGLFDDGYGKLPVLALSVVLG